MNKIFKRILSALLSIVLTIAMIPAVAAPTFAESAALAPLILAPPTDATYAKGAMARFSVSAMSQDGGSLTYEWYRSKAYTAPVDGANGIGKGSITTFGNREGGLLGDSAVLLTTTPTYAGDAAHYYYYYWCEVTNHKGGDTSAPNVSYLALVKIVNRTLPTAMVNGDMEYWRSGNVYYTDANGNTYVNGNGLSSNFADGAAYDTKNGWYTTHEKQRTESLRSVAGIVEVGIHNNYWGSGHEDALHAGHGKIVELAADVPSSLYQEIATVPGKIYEWSMDHTARNDVGSAQRIAVVIGSAINAAGDYGAGVTDRWQKNGTSTYNGGVGYPYGVNRNSYFDDVVNKLAADRNVAYSALTAGIYTTSTTAAPIMYILPKPKRTERGITIRACTRCRAGRVRRCSALFTSIPRGTAAAIFWTTYFSRRAASRRTRQNWRIPARRSLRRKQRRATPMPF